MRTEEERHLARLAKGKGNEKKKGKKVVEDEPKPEAKPAKAKA